MMRKLKLSIFYATCFSFFCLILSSSKAQAPLSTTDFDIGTAFLEPDDRPGFFGNRSTQFYALAKTKGNVYGSYRLSCIQNNLSVLWSQTIEETEHEDIVQAVEWGNSVCVFSNVHQTKAQYSVLKMFCFDAQKGTLLQSLVLDSTVVEPYRDNGHRGQVKELFTDAISASLKKNYVVPFMYQYRIEFSPDSSKLLFYKFDFSRDELICTGAVLDASFKELFRFEKAIDDGWINHEVLINNLGELFLLNTEGQGKIGVSKFVKGDRKASTYLDVTATNLSRYSFKAKFVGNEELYVVHLNDQNGACAGVTFYRFNFNTQAVENWVDHDFTENLKNKIHNERLMHKAGDENFKYWMIDQLVVNSKEDIFLILEKREIRGSGYRYDPYRTISEKNIMEASMSVVVEGLILLRIDHEGNRKAEDYFYKTQKDAASAGLNSASFRAFYEQNILRIVYADADGFSESLNRWNVAVFDLEKGEKIHQSTLENPEKLIFLQKYVRLMPNRQLCVVGRKGLLGKASMLQLYQLPR